MPASPIALVESNLDQIAAACRRFGAVRLELFGSAARGEFDPLTSDLDFLVTYDPDHDLGPWMHEHFALRDALIEIFNRPVDLTTGREFTNPYLARSIAESRVTVFYEREDAQAVK